MSYPYARGRGLRLTAFAGPFRFRAVVKARLALALGLDLDHPVVTASWSSITPLAFFDAHPYWGSGTHRKAQSSAPATWNPRPTRTTPGPRPHPKHPPPELTVPLAEK